MNSKEIQEKTIAMRNGELQMKKDGDYWTEEERDHVRSQFRSGVPANVIAIELERSENAIYQQIVQMDLYPKIPGKTRRRKSIPKEPVCLCSVCSCDHSLCPLCDVSQAAQEVE